MLNLQHSQHEVSQKYVSDPLGSVNALTFRNGQTNYKLFTEEPVKWFWRRYTWTNGYYVRIKHSFHRSCKEHTDRNIMQKIWRSGLRGRVVDNPALFPGDPWFGPETEYPDWYFSWRSSYPILGHYRFRPWPSQLIIQELFHHETLLGCQISRK
jgi:hypothetical protein